MGPTVEVVADAEAVARAGLALVVERLTGAVHERGRATLALSGGSTPKRLYELLAQEQGLPWAQLHFFFGDERHVPPDSPESNYRMAREALFSRVPIPEANLHRVEAERPAAEAAAAYERTLRTVLQVQPGDLPRLDVVLLGLGTDGHTASLFPHTPALDETRAWVVANPVEKLKTERISLTAPVLNAGRTVLFLVQGADKAPAVQAVLEGHAPVEEIPARLVQPSTGELWWLLDRAAAQSLRPSTVTSRP